MSNEERLKLYEIHYVAGSIKKIFLHSAPSMNEVTAWRVALLDSGLPYSALPLSESLTEMVEAGAATKVVRVRWNLSSKTFREAGRIL